MKVFGEDGFRDIYGKGLMSPEFLNYFFKLLSNFLKKNKIKKIIIGYDTRESFNKILEIIIKNLSSKIKIEILNKPVPTPCIHYLAKKNKNCFLVMITASHFEKNFNGFKFFYDGKKITKKIEREILKNKDQDRVFKDKNNKFIRSNKYLQYCKYLNKKFKKKNKSNRIGLDFGNGGAASLINNINFLRNIKKTNYKFNYNNINENCGSNHIKKNYRKYEYYLALDGDADRLVVANKNYGIIEPEKIFFIFYEYLNKRKKINNCICTIITNPILKEYFKNKDVKVHETSVGDRNIINKQSRFNTSIGFETSGHYSLDYAMDGLFAAALFVEIIHEDINLINQILGLKNNYKLKIINVDNKINKELKKNINEMNKKIKIISRKSIWENIVRVYIFYTKKNIQIMKKISSKLQNF